VKPKGSWEYGGGKGEYQADNTKQEATLARPLLYAKLIVCLLLTNLNLNRMYDGENV